MMDPLPISETEPELIIDWKTLDGTERPQVIFGVGGSSSKKTLLKSGETSALLGNGSGDDGDNTTDIDDWEGLPWYRKPSVRGPVFCTVGSSVDWWCTLRFFGCYHHFVCTQWRSAGMTSIVIYFGLSVISDWRTASRCRD